MSYFSINFSINGNKMTILRFGYDGNGWNVERDYRDNFFSNGENGEYSIKNFSVEQNKTENKKMDIKEKFILAITAEPKKSFRKAGITNGDDILTEEGIKIFLSWLLHNKFSEDFKKEVVDNFLKDKYVN